MKLQDILNPLLSSIRSISSEKLDTEKLALLSREMVKARQKLLSSKNMMFNAKDFTLEPTATTLREILQYLGALLSHSGNKHTPFRSPYGNSCFEIEILSTLCELQIPMDHQYEANKSMADIVAILVGKIYDFLISTPSTSIGSRNVLFFLYALTLIDCAHNPTLARACSDAIKLSVNKCSEMWTNCSFECESAIRFLWLDAKLSLVNDTNQCLITRGQVVMILQHIDREITALRFKLDKILAKQLFQVYGMHLAYRSEFPAKLSEAMNSFLPEMRSETSSSAFEVKIQREIKQIIAGYKKDKMYQYVNFERGFNFNNPLNELSLESDFEYRDNRAGIVLSFQVDGKKYHNVTTSSQTPARANLSTRFRNRLFSNLGTEVVEIDDNGLSLYRQQLEAIFLDKIVYPTFLSLQQELLRTVTRSRDSLVSNHENFKKQRTNLKDDLKALTERGNSLTAQIEVLKQLSSLAHSTILANPQSKHIPALQALMHNVEVEIKKRLDYIAAVNAFLLKEKAFIRPKFSAEVTNIVDNITSDLKLYASYRALKSEKLELDQQFDTLKDKHNAANGKIEQADKLRLKDSEIQSLRDAEMAIHSQIVKIKPKMQTYVKSLSEIQAALTQGKPYTTEVNALVLQDKKLAEALSNLSALAQETKALLSNSACITTDELSKTYEAIERDIAQEKERRRQALITGIIQSQSDLSEFCNLHKIFCMMAYDCALTKDLGTKSEEDLLSIQKKLDETYTLRKGDVEKFKLTKSNLIKRLDETITKMKFSFKNLLLLEECKVLMTKLERAQSKLDLPPLEKEVDRIECLVETTIQSKMVRKPLSPVLPQAVGYLSSDGMSYPGSLVQMLPATAISPFAPAYSNHAQSMKTSAKINNSATIQVPDDPSFRSNFG